MTTIEYFDVRDVFRAPRAGLGVKKLRLSLNGIFLAYLGYAVFTYLSRMATAMTISGIWATQGLWPVPACAQYTWPGWILFLIGFIFAGVILLLTATGVCRLSLQQFKGNDFYTVADARSFSLKNWAAVVLPPLIIAGLMVFFIISGSLLALVGKIPVVGELAVSLAMIPAIFCAILVAFMAIVLHMHFALGPAILGTTGGDAVDVVVQLFSCTWSQPWRFLFYEFLLKGLTVFAVHILVLFLTAGLWILRAVLSPVMGPKFLQIFQIGYDFARIKCPVLTLGCTLSDRLCNIPIDSASHGLQRCLDVLFGADLSGAGWSIVLSGHIFGVALFFCMLCATAYCFSTWFSGQTIIYLILRRRKDLENLLVSKDDDEWLEEIPTESAVDPDLATMGQGESPDPEPPGGEKEQ